MKERPDYLAPDPAAAFRRQAAAWLDGCRLWLAAMVGAGMSQADADLRRDFLVTGAMLTEAMGRTPRHVRCRVRVTRLLPAGRVLVEIRAEGHPFPLEIAADLQSRGGRALAMKQAAAVFGLDRAAQVDLHAALERWAKPQKGVA